MELERESPIINELRRRLPLQFVENFRIDAEEEDQRVLDEQEQEETINKIAADNEPRLKSAILGAHILVTLSLLLHLYYLFRTSKESPLLSIFPSDAPAPPLPFSTLLALFNVFSHIILLLRLRPRSFYKPPLRGWLRLDESPYAPVPPASRAFIPGTHPPVPFVWPRLATPTTPFSPMNFPAITFYIAVTSLLLWRAWQTTVWWAIAPTVYFIMSSVEEMVRRSDESIESLRLLRYRAPGA
ncbi:uncharacterized protein SCHCODRAFT_02615666 [Schizophyllum commune H4-8]|nr:uncharacterized protein SCHCODRAFT_02615666 [Schizophyllum commune H4-8]KAI5896730.1 hypothetical protein SCHCODRAFT_02615666 [Schizophyllum commune H4-8]